MNDKKKPRLILQRMKRGREGLGGVKIRETLIQLDEIHTWKKWKKNEYVIEKKWITQ